MLKRFHTKVYVLLFLLFSCAGAGYSQVEVGVGGRPDFNNKYGVNATRLEVFGRIRMGASNDATAPTDPARVQSVVDAMAAPPPIADFGDVNPPEGDVPRWVIVSNRAGIFFGIRGDINKQGQVLTWDEQRGWILKDAPGNRQIISPDGSITIVNGDTIRLSIRPCGDGQILVYDVDANPPGWVCANVPGGDTLPDCADGQFLRYDATLSQWVCVDLLPGQQLLPTGCAADQILVFDGTNWICADAPPGTTVTTSGPVQGDGSTNNPVTLAPCGPDQILQYVNGAWTCVDPPNGLPNCNAGQTLIFDGTNWVCIDTTGLNDAWLLEGNTIDATKFIGTLNDEDFRIRTNNTQRMVVLRDGKVVVNNAAGAATDRFSSYLNAGDPEIYAIRGYAIAANGAGTVGGNTHPDGSGAIGLGNNIGTPIFPPTYLGSNQSAGVIGNGTVIGTFGYATLENKQTFGVVGITNSHVNDAAGVYGIADNVGGATLGVRGESYSEYEGATGVYGLAASASATVYGVYGIVDNNINNSVGVAGEATGLGGTNYGVVGQTLSETNTSAGVFGNANSPTGRTAGVRGTSVSNAINARGVEGVNTATSGKTQGVFGRVFSNTAGASGVLGTTEAGETYGVMGHTSSNTSFSAGVYGVSDGQGLVGGGTYIGVYGACYKNTGTRYGVYSWVPDESNAFSFYGHGDMQVEGNFSASGLKQFKIDHPLDPANKYLKHICPESNEALNFYSGNITTNGNGEATVILPDYFEAINKDFRYNLTCVGTFANAIVAQKISNNRFIIKTDKPNVEVSWMVTGVRNDKYVQANPPVIEEEKAPEHRGKYLIPQLYNQPADKAINYQVRPAGQPAHATYNPAEDNTRADYKLELKRPKAQKLEIKR